MFSRVPQEALGKRPGAGDAAQTHARPSTRRTLSGPRRGAPRGSHPPCLQTHLAGGVHTHGPAPATDHSDPGTQTRRSGRPRTLGHTQAPFSGTHRDTRRRMDTTASSRPDAHPEHGAHCAQARPRVPAPLPAAPVGAGRPGGGSCDTAREAARGWAAPATSSSSSRSQPAEPGQGRAEGSEGAGGAGRGAMAHQTGIHGEGGWRAGRGQRVSARGCAPSPARPLSPPRHQPAGASSSLFAAADRLGWAHLGGGRTDCA